MIPTTRLRQTSSAQVLVLGLIVGALLGFVVGLGVGDSTSATSSPPATAALADTLPDVRFDAVSQRLRDAYYAGGGATEVCSADVDVVCHPAIPVQSAERYTDIVEAVEPADLVDLKPAQVTAGHIIVASALGPTDGAAIVRLEGDAPTDRRQLVVANPDRQGIDYVDLGNLAPGRYLVSIGVPGLRMPTILLSIDVE